MPEPSRKRARELALESVAAGKPLDWFEQLYREAAQGDAHVPWDDRVPNPHLVRWLDEHGALFGAGIDALDVGCGTGDNTAELARRGLRAIGFDVSETAIATARARFGTTVAELTVGDVLALPQAWHHHFGLVVEVYTLQVLPPPERARAARAIAETVAPAGHLVVIARGRDPHEPEGQMPWPLTKSEIEAIGDNNLRLESLVDVMDEEDPPVRRFTATFVRVR